MIVILIILLSNTTKSIFKEKHDEKGIFFNIEVSIEETLTNKCI